MDAAQTFAAQTELQKHFGRELANHSERASILDGLLRRDRGRMQFLTADAVIDHFGVQRAYVAERGEESVFEAAQLHGLKVVLGYSLEIGCRPEEFAWLTNPYGELIDPARGRRAVDAYLGVELRHGEAARWTPTQPAEVVGGNVAGLKVS